MFSKKKQVDKKCNLREKHNRDEQYTKVLHFMPCTICKKLPVETHHVDGRKYGTNDHRQIPLCVEHHRGTMGIHNMGNISFQNHFNINVYAEADELYAYYAKKVSNG